MTADGKEHVLLLDDDALQLRVRAMVLEQAGYGVATAESLDRALDLFKAGSGFKAVVTDHLLAGENGVEFVRRLRQMDANVPVIVITGLPWAEGEYAGLKVTFLFKPCPAEELIAAVRQSRPAAAR
ncbi:MAG TPA: response regulator [Terriglobales bacterium]|nr:response regulator [Terriglobales bacterium]